MRAGVACCCGATLTVVLDGVTAESNLSRRLEEFRAAHAACRATPMAPFLSGRPVREPDFPPETAS